MGLAIDLVLSCPFLFTPVSSVVALLIVTIYDWHTSRALVHAQAPDHRVCLPAQHIRHQAEGSTAVFDLI